MFDVSTNSVLSVELSRLAPLVLAQVTAEDEARLGAAVAAARESRELLRAGNFAAALHKASKAVRRVEELVELRKEASPLVGVLAAPFYFVQAYGLISYVESNVDMFGNVPVLPEVEDSSD